MKSIIAGLVLLSSVVKAAPIAVPAAEALAILEARQRGLVCYYPVTYSQTAKPVKKLLDPVLMSGTFVTGGNSITATRSFEKSVTWNGGISASLSLLTLFDVAGDAGVAVSFTTGSSIASNLNCPGTTGMCGAVAQGWVIDITGQMRVDPCQGAATTPVDTTKPPAVCAANGVCNAGKNSATYNKWVPVTAEYPVKAVSGGLVNGHDEMAVTWSACYVPGYAPGTLKIPCPGVSLQSAAAFAAKNGVKPV